MNVLRLLWDLLRYALVGDDDRHARNRYRR